MFQCIRRRLGVAFSLGMVLVLSLAVAGLGFLNHLRLEDLAASVTQENEQALRSQAAALLARAVQDEASHYDAAFLMAQGLINAVATQTAFLLDHDRLHLADPWDPTDRMSPLPNGFVANSPKALASAFAWGPEARTGAPQRALQALSHIDPLLAQITNTDVTYAATWVIGAQGFARYYPNLDFVRALPPAGEYDPRRSVFFRLVTPAEDPGRRTRWTPLYNDEVTHSLMVSVCAPVYSSTGTFLGAAGLDIPVQAIASYLFNQPHPAVTLPGGVRRTRFEREFSLLVAPDGRLVAAPQDRLDDLGLTPDPRSIPGRVEQLNLNLSDNPDVRRLAEAVRGGSGGALTMPLQGERWAVFHHPIPTTGWSLCQFAPEAELLAPVLRTKAAIEQTTAAIVTQTAWATVGFLLAAAAASLLFFRYLLLRPIRRLQEGFASLASGRLETRLDGHLPGELGALAEAFNDTAGRLEEHRAALLQAEGKFRDLFENAVNGIYRTTVGGKVLDANPAMARMFGYDSPTEMAAQVVRFSQQHYVNPADRERLVALAREQGEIRGQEIAFLRRDGNLLWASVNARAIHDAEGLMSVIEGTVEDITQRKQAEENLAGLNEQLSAMNEELSSANEEMASTNEELIQSNDELLNEIARRREIEEDLRKSRLAAEAASHAKSEFLANMSHEIRTPLNAVMGMLQLLSRTAMDKEQKEYADIALLSSRSLLSVINDILDLSAVEAGKMVLQEELFEPAALVGQVAASFLAEAQQKGLTLEWTLDDNVPQVLLGDTGRLRQVLFNLLGNAVKFTEHGGVGLWVRRLPVDPAPGRARLLLAVTDSGIGIPPDKVDYLFEPFTQADGSFRRKYQGTGLGLGIVKRIVTLMRGTIVVDSEPGLGSTVLLTVEAGLPSSAPELIVQRRRHLRDPQARLKILVAEDSRINRILAVRVLGKLGHTVVEAENGRQALEILAREAFDLLLLDIQMPEIDGLELTRRIRSGDSGVLDRDIPILAMTAHAMKGDRETFLQAGMNGYLAKPFDLDEFSETLRQVLSRA